MPDEQLANFFYSICMLDVYYFNYISSVPSLSRFLSARIRGAPSSVQYVQMIVEFVWNWCFFAFCRWIFLFAHCVLMKGQVSTTNIHFYARLYTYMVRDELWRLKQHHDQICSQFKRHMQTVQTCWNNSRISWNFQFPIKMKIIGKKFTQPHRIRIINSNSRYVPNWSWQFRFFYYLMKFIEFRFMHLIWIRTLAELAFAIRKEKNTNRLLLYIFATYKYWSF